MFLPLLIPLLFAPIFAVADNLPRVAHHDPMVIDSQLSLAQVVDLTFEKYPDSFRYFTPDCRKNDFRFCNKQALINAYDNTILYTDFVLSQVIETLQEHHTLFNSALIYTSDHGESLGEKGIYEHCTPYVIAPIEQTQVPLIVWMSDEFMKQKSLSKLCLQKKALHGAYSHDFIFHSILGLMDIQTTVYQPPLDIFESCRKTRSY